jgi:hypothetical protein
VKNACKEHVFDVPQRRAYLNITQKRVLLKAIGD